MAHTTLGTRLAFAALLAALCLTCSAACSGSDAKGMRGNGLPNGGTGGSTPAPGGSGGQDFNNAAGTMMIQPIAGMDPPVMNDPPPSSREPISIDGCGMDNLAGLSPEDAQKLVAGSGAPGGLRVLYPYDGTVFPRGLL